MRLGTLGRRYSLVLMGLLAIQSVLFSAFFQPQIVYAQADSIEQVPPPPPPPPPPPVVVPPLEPTRISAQTFFHHLGLAREALTREDVRDFLNEAFKDLLNREPVAGPNPAPMQIPEPKQPLITELLETQLLLFLRENPAAQSLLEKFLGALRKLEAVPPAKRDAAWKAKRNALSTESKNKVNELLAKADVLATFKLLNDPLEPYWAETLDGGPSYENIKLFVSHDYTVGEKIIPAANLIEVMREFVLSARHQISANFYEFDYEPLADAFIAQAKKGLKIRIGIDKDVIEANEVTKALYKKMKAGGVEVVAVDSVSLNHQKLITIDPEFAELASTIFSSGNATISDTHQKGDLEFLPDDKRPKESIPNANHLLVVKGQLPAMVTFHQLEKTLNPRFLLRGSEFPYNGAIRFRGPIDPKTNEPKQIVLAFTPGGGFKSINKLLISRVIRETIGPLYMAQFAFSSNTTGEALVERVAAELARGLDPDFHIVGETPFAMQFWSQLLRLSGLKLLTNPDGKKEYVNDPEAPINKVLSGEKLAKFQEAIRIAPQIYSRKSHLIDGETYETVAKIHHKVLISGIVSILGTSFNFSTGAESNNEQILVITDSELAELGIAMINSLWNMGTRSVTAEAKLRNERGGHDGEIDPDVDRRKRTPLPKSKLKPCEDPLT